MKVFEFIKQVVQPFRYYLLGPIFVMTFCAVDTILRPYLTKLLIDSVITKSGQEAINAVTFIAGVYIALQFSIVIAWRIYDWFSLKYEPALKNHIVRTLASYVSDHSHHYFQNNFAGSIASKINDAAGFVPPIIKTIIDRFYTSALIIMIAAYAFWHIHQWFALAIIIWSFVFVTVSALVIKKFNYLSNHSAESVSKIIGNIVDFLGNMSSVRYFVGKKQELTKLDLYQDDYLQISQTRRWFLLKLYAVLGITFAIYQTICLALLIYLYAKNQVTPGDFAMILTLNLTIMELLWITSNEMRTFSENVGTVDQALKVIYVPHEIQDIPNANKLDVSKGEIVFENVQFHYQGDEPLFENKSVQINPGQKVGLVGFSGSGKTTFVNLILRLFDVTQGRILIDNQEIKNVTQTSLRQAIGMIPQDPSLFHRSLMENIRYGRGDSTQDEVIQAAKRAHAHEFIVKLPQGYDSLVGERGIKLSGGQRQRIAIARAILKNAPILILDEATSQLDSISEKYIQESLWELMQNKTTIVIAHRLSTLLNMDRILVFDRGKIVQDGSHETLLSSEGLYKTLWEAQIGGFLLDNLEITDQAV
ncbi:MAG: ABC transporter ATP-binding protein [Gammaproteobacteria bacterium]|jgi:ATP-binding cassette subfamily B protein|nr:ABC transporter ATP-binding protein [Gammaproteobacteria bacterium]